MNDRNKTKEQLISEIAALRKQVSAIQESGAERVIMEEVLSWEINVNKALTEVSGRILTSATIEDISNLVLEHAKYLTGSAFGYVGYINPDTGFLIAPTLTRDIWDICAIEDKSVVFEKFHGLWGWVLRNRQSLLSNTPQKDPRAEGVPKGHMPITRFLSVPALVNGKLVGQIALANAEADYTEGDLDFVERLAALYGLAVQRRQTEEALHLEKERAQRYFDVAGVMLIVIDSGFMVSQINKKGCEITGYPEAEIVGKDWIETCIPENDRMSVREVFAQILSGDIERFEYFENPVITKPGEERIIAWHNTILRNDEGNIIGTLSSGEDVTEQKRIEQALSESEEKYRTLVENVNIGIYRNTGEPHGHFLHANHALAALFGYNSVEELMRVRTSDLYQNPKDRRRFIEKIRKQGFVRNEELQLKKKSGTPFWGSVTSRAHFNQQGEIEWIDGVIEDITERKKIDETLRALSLIDELTGLYNRRGFMTLAEQQMKIANRMQRGMLLVFTDLDGLKEINDTFGHNQGDMAITDTAEILRKTFRQSDIIARIGGDEFVALVIETIEDTAETLKTRLEEKIKSQNAAGGKKYRISLSTGVTHYDPATPRNLNDMLTEADRLMYEQKQLRKKRYTT
jgi:diguanylate cyclase (GGDEF)-like protein/PAS domain S-box-containing protein